MVTVDVGTRNDPTTAADVSRQTIASHQGDGGSCSMLDDQDRGAAIAALSEALTRFLVSEHGAGKVAGVIGLAGAAGPR